MAEEGALEFGRGDLEAADFDLVPVFRHLVVSHLSIYIFFGAGVGVGGRGGWQTFFLSTM